MHDLHLFHSLCQQVSYFMVWNIFGSAQHSKIFWATQKRGKITPHGFTLNWLVMGTESKIQISFIHQVKTYETHSEQLPTKSQGEKPQLPSAVTGLLPSLLISVALHSMGLLVKTNRCMQPLFSSSAFQRELRWRHFIRMKYQIWQKTNTPNDILEPDYSLVRYCLKPCCWCQMHSVNPRYSAESWLLRSRLGWMQVRVKDRPT